ncbi:hypothetical protein [Nocardia coubleae]|uniref:Uncharacterized protein n=1 Tax=Nocardia coubleae TaxID=356147 RepID=A0A846W4F9_9NOCA|nr:hypothetical protein [Nocardia coubleae]NKX88139.1 hypothetical protein [Nocardia coubleae]
MARSTMITINSTQIHLSDEQVFLATRGRTPETPKTYVVLVNNALWPPMQLIRLATGSGQTAEFNSHTALKALNELGFPTFERVEYDSRGAVVVRESRQRN